MVDSIEKALDRWQLDAKTDENSEHNKYQLPWIVKPVNQNRLEQYCSYIPEDALKFLQYRVSLSSLSKEEIAPSFHKSVDRLDINLHAAFIQALIFLAEQFVGTISNINWCHNSKLCENLQMRQEEFYERLIWLSAVVNDCNRVVDEQHCSPTRLIAESNPEGRRQHYNNTLLAESTRELSLRAYDSFKNCAQLAVKEMAKVRTPSSSPSLPLDVG